MFCFTPSLVSGDARRTLAQLVTSRFGPDSYSQQIQSLQRMFSGCPLPCAAFGQHTTAELHYQSEHWLPLEQLRPHFFRFYRQALTCSPVLPSTPFADAKSWAGIVSRFPPFLRNYANPSVLLQRLMLDEELRLKFLFWSFMPERYYGGGSDRYPGQTAVIGAWVRHRAGRLRCLDAACGDGAASYGLARLLLERGWHHDRFWIEGWTLDPLEAWAAAHGAFPHNPQREAAFRGRIAPVFTVLAQRALRFRAVDLITVADDIISGENDRFDLIVCNGLLGGPIIKRQKNIRRIVSYLCDLLAPGGLLLVADHFHGGWKKNIPGEILGDAFKACGLMVAAAGEGLAGLKPD